MECVVDNSQIRLLFVCLCLVLLPVDEKISQPPACNVSLVIYLNTIHSNVASEMISQGYAVQWLR